jgi:hypothetical protein
MTPAQSLVRSKTTDKKQLETGYSSMKCHIEFYWIIVRDSTVCFLLDFPLKCDIMGRTIQIQLIKSKLSMAKSFSLCRLKMN